MTRAAAREGVEHYLGRLVHHAYESFDVVAAVRGGTSGTGGRLVSRLLKRSEALDRRVVRPELDRYREQALSQFEAILDYAAAETAIGTHREAVLADDQYAAALRGGLPPERRRTVEDALVERSARVGDAVAPLVAAPQDDFWAALVHAYDEAAAEAAVRDAVSFTGPLERFPDAFVFEVAIDPADYLGALGAAAPEITVDYTAEAARCLTRAETAVREEVTRDVARRYGGA